MGSEKLADGRLDAAIVSIGVDEHPPGLKVQVTSDEAFSENLL